MDLNITKQLATALIQAHGLRGWRFEFDRSKVRFGLCDYRRRVISLSPHLTLANDFDEVMSTLIHEVAHALMPGEGHGPKWKAKCIELGGDGKRCYSNDKVTAVDSPYSLVCPQCDRAHPRHRRTNTGYLCRRCRVRMTWRDNRAAA